MQFDALSYSRIRNEVDQKLRQVACRDSDGASTIHDPRQLIITARRALPIRAPHRSRANDLDAAAALTDHVRRHQLP